MNKKLIALAVSAAALAPAVYAENEVILYGQINVAIQGGKTDSLVGAAQSDNIAVNDMLSRIGFKGQEDLGGGLSAFFQVETELAADTARSINSKGNGFANREGWVGLKGDFGTIKLGRGKSLYTIATEELDPYFMYKSLGLTFNSDNYRVDNTIRYQYEAGGLTVGVENAFGENKAGNKKANNDFGASAKFASESFSVFGSIMNQRRDGSPTAKLVVLGGTLPISDLTLGAAIQRRDSDLGSTDKFTDTLVSATYVMGDVSLNAGVIRWDKDMGNAKAQLNLAFYNNLSKRTVAMVEYTNNHQGQRKNNVLSVGLSHSF